MLPVLRQLEGEGKEAVCSHGFGRYSIPEGEMGTKSFCLIPTHSAASLPPCSNGAYAPGNTHSNFLSPV